MKKFLLLAFVLSAVFSLFAYDGTTIGPEVSQLDGKKLQWEAGSFDYFVMFKSLMGNDIREICSSSSSPAGCDWSDNPEPDSCLPQSTFQLTNQHVPEDAYVEAAYLVWTSSLDPNNVNYTDNTATLNYISDDGQINETVNVVAPRIGAVGTDANPGIQDFTFEGITGGFESAGTIYGGFYTYRVDVTPLFNDIHNQGRNLGYPQDGMSLYGKYTVSDVDCSNSSTYLSQVDMFGSGYSASVMCGWSLITVYRSTKVNPKMVYIYNGFGSFCKQEVNLGISGFEFPDKPIIKMTLALHEGDPGLANSAYSPEGLQVTGQTTDPSDLVILENQCNPGKSDGSFNYSDTYNSISSVYGWNDTAETCIGGDPNSPDPNSLEYTMDVDTFRLDAEAEPVFDAQFKKGDQSMFIKIGANSDCIYPNYMVVSLDTKAPRFDIPVNPKTPDGREKNICSCSEQSDTVCPTAPFYFMIKVQNWGDDISTNVTVQDTLATSKINYVPGTTEMCKDWKSDNVCRKWIPIEDVNGTFPLTNPYKVADALYYCDQATQTCDETIMIRFKVQPKDGLAKNEVIENTAIINDDSNRPYRSNTSIPLRLTFGTCPSAALCENPDLTDCGGYGDGEGCTKKEDCGVGQTCQDGACVTDSSQFTQNAQITVSAGKNTPISGEAPIIITSPADKLVAGQFSVIASTEESGKIFTFESVITSLNIKDPNTKFENMQLVYDKNGNGRFDDGESVVATTPSVNAKTATFALKSESSNYAVNELHHFIIVTDVKYDLTEIPLDTTFNFNVEEISSFKFANAGNFTAEINGKSLDFAKFSFEPTVEAFVFTKGSVEPSVPSPSEINKSPVGILQIRAKSIKSSNKIKKITLKTTSKSVKFNEGIKKISVYLDVNKDAMFAEEKVLATVTPDETSNILDINFDVPIEFAADEEKTLLLVASFNIPKDEMAQVEIQKSKVKLESGGNLIGLPIKSKEFSYKCDAGDLTCSTDNDDNGGCAVTAIEENDSVLLTLSAVAALLLGLIAALRRFFFSK